MNLETDEVAALDSGAFAEALRRQVRYGYGKPFAAATRRDLLDAVCLACREWVVDRMLASEDVLRWVSWANGYVMPDMIDRTAARLRDAH